MERVRTECYSASLKECPLEDGWVRVEGLTSCTKWMASWVMSFGLDAEVEEPMELREEIRSLVERMVARYRPTNVLSGC